MEKLEIQICYHSVHLSHLPEFRHLAGLTLSLPKETSIIHTYYEDSLDAKIPDKLPLQLPILLNRSFPSGVRSAVPAPTPPFRRPSEHYERRENFLCTCNVYIFRDTHPTSAKNAAVDITGTYNLSFLFFPFFQCVTIWLSLLISLVGSKKIGVILIWKVRNEAKFMLFCLTIRAKSRCIFKEVKITKKILQK